MDNVRFHRGPTVQEKMEIRGLEWKFLPPYTPYFNEWTHFVKRNELMTTAELIAATDAAATYISAENTWNMSDMSIPTA